jgi:hypothetical protein
MKQTHSNTAPRTAAGITNKVMPVVVACLLAGGGFSRAQEAPDNVPGPDARLIAASTNAAPAEDTNSPVTAIAGELLLLKVRLESAVAAMSNALASTPAQQAANVTKLAEGISELATNELADGGQIVKHAEALVAKFNDSVAAARKRSNDPNLRPAAREIYGQLLPGLEGELAKLIDAKSTVVRIRAELLRQAEGLRQSAEAIGFAEHCNKLLLASQAFRATLTEALRFAGNIASLIQSVGKATAIE